MAYKDFVKTLNMKAPELLYFDHLYSEYRALKPNITDAQDKSLIDEIYARRNDSKLTWNDIYAFELAISKYLSVETLHDKVLSLRFDYLKVAGQEEFSEYKASNPPDVSRPPNPLPDNYKAILQADIKYLLDKLYLQYAMLPVREARLKRLTVGAAVLCTIFLIIISVLMVSIALTEESKSSVRIVEQPLRVPSLAVFVVMVAGAMGGFVSSLQRIQTPSSEGSSIYNLSLLFTGSYSVFISPLSGAIFAILLYLMFTGGILEGRFFPKMYTPVATLVAAPSPSLTAAIVSQSSATVPSPDASPATINNNLPRVSYPTKVAAPTVSLTVTPSATPSPILSPSPSPIASPSPAAKASPSSPASPSPAPTPEPQPNQSIRIGEFLTKSGPAGGADYAMLIIWCFIAGFAERFVPDALDRLIAGKS